MKHTPGPWKIIKNKHTRLVFVNGFPLFKDGLDKYSNRDQEWIDAHLIAAAPELLDTLKTVTQQLRYINGCIEEENPELSEDMLLAIEDIDDNITIAEEVIKKATGE